MVARKGIGMTAPRSARPDPTATTDATPEPTSSGPSSRATRTPSTGRRRSTPPRVQARATEAPDVTGVVGDASAQVSRSGEDVRKRGWFWHWNSIVTQYAPLLGLKGVGLLNSYTVWTDRREESPHRGYAFPSQQSEADFYGEDRAELITINKILVALDLIEIRKEMVLRVDAQGRRWKVPHNLYRVKDHGDDVSLTTKDVLRVIDLADRDRAVYRYLRRVFSPRFSPIDHANVWHQILEEVRPTPAWQRLAARAEKEERKASERTKAGHASRKGTNAGSDDRPGDAVSSTGTDVFLLPTSGDSAASETTGVASNASTDNDSRAGADADREGRAETIVASINRGLEGSESTDVEPGNTGLGRNRASTVGRINTGDRTIVAPSNTTYHQSKTTTTEVDEDGETTDGRRERPTPADRFGNLRAPDASRDEAIALQRFAEANDRQPTMAERRHLRQLADFASPIVEAGEGTAWHLVSSAIEEAVAAGSSFVAPKRIREILARWSRDGVPAEYAGTVPETSAGDGLSRQGNVAVTGARSDSHRAGPEAGNADADLLLPNGRSAQAIWENVGREVASALGSGPASDVLAGTAIVAYDAGEVTIRVRDEAQAAALTGAHASLVGKALRAQLRRPIRLATVLAESDGIAADAVDVDVDVDVGAAAIRSGDVPASSRRATRGRPARPEPVTLGAIPVFTVERCGLTNRQLWSMALNDLRADGVIPAADIDAWLRDAALLAMEDGNAVDMAADGRDGAVTFLLGVPHVLAQRRVEARFRPAIAATLAMLLGDEAADVGLEVMIIREWHARSQQSA